MKDMNAAKLTSADLSLFNGIISDLFPGIEMPTVEHTIVSILMFVQIVQSINEPMLVYFFKFCFNFVFV